MPDLSKTPNESGELYLGRLVASLCVLQEPAQEEYWSNLITVRIKALEDAFDVIDYSSETPFLACVKVDVQYLFLIEMI